MKRASIRHGAARAIPRGMHAVPLTALVRACFDTYPTNRRDPAHAGTCTGSLSQTPTETRFDLWAQ